jgi:YesN/AraC family two-component response regulator
MTIRVLLVDDENLVRSGFRLILEAEHDIEVVGEAANGVVSQATHRKAKHSVSMPLQPAVT